LTGTENKSSGTPAAARPPKGVTGGNLIPLGQRAAFGTQTGPTIVVGSNRDRVARRRTSKYQLCPCQAFLMPHQWS
jgi:hypothetical protein